MSHKKKHGNPVPPANRPQAGPADAKQPTSETGKPGGGAPLQEQDAKRRLGDYTGKGEHAYQQPGGLNDANR